MRTILAAIAVLLVLPASALAAPPTVTFTAPTASAVAGPLTVTADASDDVAVTKVEFRVRGILRYTDNVAPYTGVLLTGLLPDGPAPIKATAFDADGNTTSATLDVVIDNTKPTLSLNGPDKQRFFPGTTQSWNFDASDGGSGVSDIRCSVQPMDTPPVFGPCTSAKAFVLSGQAEGLWTFTVRAADAAGNFAQQARDIKIDGTPPETTIVSGPDGDTSLTWELQASENATFECRIVPADFVPCTGEASHTVAGLSPGTYTFEARARDLTGNVDPTPAQSVFTVPAPDSTAAPAPAGAAPVAEAFSGDAPPQIEIAIGFSFSSTSAATKLSGFVVKNVPAGATVTVKCPSGCARKLYRKHKRTAGRLLLSPVLKKQLKVGTEITVIVSKPGATSAVKVLTIRARKAPLVTTLCQPEGSAKPVAC
ncbi:Ig-like domain-containing protein [Solirubrobacter soli]|uniref:Ig-like domain-containing protein n=1 Tax=Solirubrobacter soli TaxID=363832 RepID=UPI000425E83E|nr:Ig-like domain-containing protein [Solirubrobacter soli]